MELTELGITGVTAILLTFFVMGFVEFAKALVQKQWRDALIIGVAGLAGAVAAPLLGLSVITGICGGFAASGAVTLAKNVGDNF